MMVIAFSWVLVLYMHSCNRFADAAEFLRGLRKIDLSRLPIFPRSCTGTLIMFIALHTHCVGLATGRGESIGCIKIGLEAADQSRDLGATSIWGLVHAGSAGPVGSFAVSFNTDQIQIFDLKQGEL
jgi:hypothetical protein